MKLSEGEEESGMCRIWLEPSPGSRLCLDEHGRLGSTLFRILDDWIDIESPTPPFWDAVSHCEGLYEACRPQMLWAGSEAAALLSPRAQSGDFLVKPDRFGMYYSECLVVGYYRSDVYEIIGLAMINDNLPY